jgi:indole-3-glycerol phosphate synthase
MSLLEQILERKRAEIDALNARPRASRPVGRPHDFAAALSRPVGEKLRLMAEIKFRSPSAGPLSRALDAGARALAYARGGVAAISVLCDRHFFDGGYEHLEAARDALDRAQLAVPLLAKEFVLDEVQLDAARDHGASATLLIARILSPSRLCALVDAARHRGLEPLVEVVDERELAVALTTHARVIGVNARDLDTLVMDAERAARVLAAIPRERIALHLSGVKGPDDVAQLARGRADGALVGETLMRKDDPTPHLEALVAAG